jgi:glyoxylase-like metal-dependent hydrolase (beta-lactamase superfamily II)
VVDVRIERVLAPNAGPFTGPGTNTWLLESAGKIVAIDPGPVSDSHLEAIVTAIGNRPVAAVLVTHTHSDHAPLANPLARELGVPAYGHAPGPDFDPDLRLVDGSTVAVGDISLQVIHTPGHSDDHLCFLSGRILFTGDHIMGGSSVMVEDMGDYLRSLEKLEGLELDRLYPGHGPEIEKPHEVISWYIAHRLQREQEIVDAIAGGAHDVEAIVETVYWNVDPALHPLAARSVTAHLRKLEEEGRIPPTA